MRVLVTGGTGSLGSALMARWLADPQVERLVCYSRSEWGQARLAERLGPSPKLRWFLGDVRDRDRLGMAMRGCDAVVHAAALKRVDAVAYNPSEVIATNIAGTENVLHAGVAAGVRSILVISSDKQTEAANVYGVTKAAAEHLAVAWNAYSYPQGCHVACLRYGNVLGSRGSVAHAFRRALRAQRALPLTDPGMTRFWLPMPEAAAAVGRALEQMRGGEVFVPRLGAASLLDLAHAVAQAEGVDSPRIAVTGLRPGGEKKHETLLSRHESGRAVLLGDAGEAWFVVEPFRQFWTAGRVPWQGEGLPEDYAYTSDAAPKIPPLELARWCAEAGEEP